MRYVFVKALHEDIGIYGWKMKDQPNFEPVAGMGVAHDILEHAPGGNESTEDELQAIGGMLLVRGESGNLTNGFYSTEYAIASSICTVIRYACDGMGLRPPPKTKRIEYVEDMLAEVMKESKRFCESEFRDDPSYLEAAKQYLPYVIGWLRIGYRNAYKRYNRSSRMVQDWVSYAFTQIKDEADKFLQVAEEGCELIVSVVLSTCRVSFKLKEPTPDYN